jgi:hypothetical protein
MLPYSGIAPITAVVVPTGSTWFENETVIVPRRYSVPMFAPRRIPPVAGMAFVEAFHQCDVVLSVDALPPKPTPPKLVTNVVPGTDAVVLIVDGATEVFQAPNATSPLRVEFATKKFAAIAERPSLVAVAVFVPLGVIRAYTSKRNVSDCWADVNVMLRGVAAL